MKKLIIKCVVPLGFFFSLISWYFLCFWLVLNSQKRRWGLELMILLSICTESLHYRHTTPHPVYTVLDIIFLCCVIFYCRCPQYPIFTIIPPILPWMCWEIYIQSYATVSCSLCTDYLWKGRYIHYLDIG